jgi:hypothetical protein
MNIKGALRKLAPAIMVAGMLGGSVVVAVAASPAPASSVPDMHHHGKLADDYMYHHA